MGKYSTEARYLAWGPVSSLRSDHVRPISHRQKFKDQDSSHGKRDSADENHDLSWPLKPFIT